MLKFLVKKHQLSEQQLLDCSARDNGCNGGWPTGTFEHIQNNGVAYLNEHPYLGRETGCSSSKLKGIKFVKSFDYCENDCTEEKIYKLLTRGSLVTAMNADDTVMNWRPKSETSIFPGKGCSSTDSVNHAVVISGYKNVGGHNCFIMRNSWGTGWGFGGYALFKVTESCNMNKWVWGVEVNNIGGDENKNEENQDFSKDDEFEHGKKDDKHNDKDNDDDCDDGECEDDQDNENHNVTCKDKFYTDCTSNELKYPKSCTYFTNATTHFGANLRSINPWDSWKFYTENHCAGKEISVKWEENQGKNVCFKNNKKFNVEEVSSGFMITDNLSQKLKSTQIQFFSDYCFGGSFATLQDSYSDTSLVFQAGSVPQRMNSMRFPKKGIAAVIFYEKSNFQGNSCTCFRPEGKSTEIPNLENQCSCMK